MYTFVTFIRVFMIAYFSQFIVGQIYVQILPLYFHFRDVLLFAMVWKVLNTYNFYNLMQVNHTILDIRCEPY